LTTDIPHASDAISTELYTKGFILGSISSVGYSAANGFLRSVDHCDAVWVSCVKAMPTCAIMIPWLIIRYCNGHRKMPSLKAIAALSFVAVVTHLFGNVGFQWSLNKIGIGIAVPLCLGMAIISGAVIDGLFMDAKPSGRTIVSMCFLIVSVIVLSLGGETAFEALKNEITVGNVSRSLLGWGIGSVVVAGIVYGSFGAVIKTAGRRGISQPMLMLIISTVGILFLSALSYQQGVFNAPENLGVGNICLMLLAGLCNTIAFVALVAALQLLPVTNVNLFNASQAAFGAITGVLIFAEPASPWMIAGILLTVAGLVIMKRK
jgi:drug/metabolite transporter (DMT)-like permease|tara:strand:- start:751 stop:1710 length:960 start_codon:yes stop_codon:yes gene_type:complete